MTAWGKSWLLPVPSESGSRLFHKRSDQLPKSLVRHYWGDMFAAEESEVVFILVGKEDIFQIQCT